VVIKTQITIRRVKEQQLSALALPKATSPSVTIPCNVTYSKHNGIYNRSYQAPIGLTIP